MGFKKDQISFTSMHPKDIDDRKQAQVNIYLYYLSENRNLRNRESPEMGLPQSLDYHCIITAYGGNDILDSLLLLDKVRHLLFEKPSIASQDGKTVLRFTMTDKPLESIAKLWQALQTPLRPSLYYLITERATTKG